MLTTCPECHTTFRIGQSHLAVRQGMVRCGSCAAVFNAYDSLVPDEMPPGGDLVPEETGGHPSAEGWTAEANSHHEIVPPPEAAVEAGGQPPADATEPLGDLATPWERSEAEPEDVERPAEAAAMPEESAIWQEDTRPWPEEVVTLGEAPPPQVAEASTDAESTDAILLSELPTRRPAVSTGAAWRRLGYGLLSLGLVVLLLAQLAYFLRGEIASRQPAWRPWLEQACQVLGCRIPLARDLKLLRIESSSLETDPEQPAHARLRVNLVNRSNAEQAWPHLILKLTDAKNAPLAQKAFAPADYLPKGGKPAYGVRPMDEQEFTIDLDLASVEAAGYEVKLHYP